MRKIYSYADLSHTDIGTSDFKAMDGKRVGVLMGTEPENHADRIGEKKNRHTYKT